MATPRTILFGWFAALKKPKALHFKSAFQSFYHKDEDMIPIAKIDGLDSALQDVRDNAGGSSELTETIITKGIYNDMGIPDGESYPRDITAAFKKLLSRGIAPTLVINITVQSLYEAGIAYDFTGMAQFTYNDAGAIESAQWYKDNVAIATAIVNDFIFVGDEQQTIGTSNITYKCVANYAAGDGITAGSIQAVKILNQSLPQWRGYTAAALDNTYANSSANLTKFVSTSVNADVVVSSLIAGAKVVFLSTKSNVIIYDTNNFDISSAFTTTTVSHKLANGDSVTLYKHETLEPASLGTYKLR